MFPTLNKFIRKTIVQPYIQCRRERGDIKFGWPHPWFLGLACNPLGFPSDWEVLVIPGGPLQPSLKVNAA